MNPRESGSLIIGYKNIMDYLQPLILFVAGITAMWFQYCNKEAVH